MKHDKMVPKISMIGKERRMKNCSKKLYSDSGIFLCSCGRLIKEDDIPCAFCGNQDVFTVFEGNDYSFLCMDFYRKGGEIRCIK